MTTRRRVFLAVPFAGLLFMGCADATGTGCPYGGSWDGSYSGHFTYGSGQTLTYTNSPISLSIHGDSILATQPVNAINFITSSSTDSVLVQWFPTDNTGQTPYRFTGWFKSNGQAIGTWEYTIQGNGPQAGHGSGTWNATRTIAVCLP